VIVHSEVGRVMFSGNLWGLSEVELMDHNVIRGEYAVGLVGEECEVVAILAHYHLEVEVLLEIGIGPEVERDIETLATQRDELAER
jgi:hypothetical protein